MNTTVRSKWTPRDEALFVEMKARREAIMQENRVPLMAITQTLKIEELDATAETDGADTTISYDADKFIDWMISRADALRDALEPFDSGARPATAEQMRSAREALKA